MKLAQALIVRKDLENKIGMLRIRLNANALVQEGDTPSEDPSELIKELNGCCDELIRLTAAVNRTNAASLDEDGRSITELIAEKDVLKQKSAILISFINSASCKADRHSLKEIRVQSSVNVPELRKISDGVSKKIRELDIKLQELNWKYDLIEE